MAAQAVQTPAAAQPLFASVGTHLLPHALVPGPQVPITHAPAWHTNVPPAAFGQEVSSQVVAPHPKLGSATETQRPAHFLVPEPQVPMTQVLPLQASVAVPGWGQADLSHVVAPQP